MKVLDDFFSALLCGLFCGIGIYAYVSLQDSSAWIGALALAGTFMLIELLGLKLFVYEIGDAVGKRRAWLSSIDRIITTLIGNTAGVGCISVLFSSSFAKTATAFYKSQFSPTSEKRFIMHIFFGLLAGFVLYAVHFLYDRIFEKAEGWFLFLFLAAVLSATRINFVLFDFYTIVTARIFTGNSLRILRYLLFGNSLGALFFIACYQLLDDPLKARKRNASAQTERRHHRRTDAENSDTEPAAATSSEVRRALKGLKNTGDASDDDAKTSDSAAEREEHHHHHHHHSDSEHHHYHHHHHSDSERHHHSDPQEEEKRDAQ